MTISYITGDATEPRVDEGLRVIAHVCNDRGGWGSGFVIALSKRWKKPEQYYRTWHRQFSSGVMSLGQLQMVPVEKNLFVANMVAQERFVSPENPVALRYESLHQCLKRLNEWMISWWTISHNNMICEEKPMSVHMPRIGCGLAGGDWDKVELLININLKHDVYVYDLPTNIDTSKDVHTEHCCLTHGCKYGEGEQCPVENGTKKQSSPCEVCSFDEHMRE
jgi:O-acetyl-ADP-ribose deacetylase (regulator of RNase III)